MYLKSKLLTLFLIFIANVLHPWSSGWASTSFNIDSRNQDLFYSQAKQDRFVYKLLYEFEDKTDQGYYLEIGASDPVFINNTYFLEKNCNWKGVSIDISDQYRNDWVSVRNNPLIIQDALLVDYRLATRGFPKVIDYLSLDVDSVYDQVLSKVLDAGLEFKVITIEHDSYRFGNIYRDKERELLRKAGYYLLFSDIANLGNPYEDWWINPSYFSRETFERLQSLSMGDAEHTTIIEHLEQ